MRPRTLRARVALAAALSILLAVVALGAGVEIFLARQLHRSLDATLRERAAEVSQLAASAPAVLTTPGALDSPLGGRELSVEVLDRQGRIVARSLALGGRVLPQTALVQLAIKRGKTGYGDISLGSDRLRVYVAPLAELGGKAAGGAVIVGSSTGELHETLARLRDILILSALFAAATAAVAAAWLLQRALRPLGRLSAAAVQIERTGDPRHRLPEPETGDELARLAETLNRMLGSLDRARDRERRFVADASHELRNPLTALQGNVAYVARHGAAPTDDVISDLAEDTRRMSALIDSLLHLSREDAAGPPEETVRLDELARHVARAGAGIEVQADEPIVVRGDRAALERALLNLVENARRHGPPGGSITVSAVGVDGLARLTVRDEGVGLTAEEAALAFERFWRGAGDARGSGLGLAIVRATAERHGGRAYAEGSTFTIELPALREPSESGGRSGGVPTKGTP